MESGDHLHNGVIAAFWATLIVVAGINVWRFAAAKAVTSSNPTVAAIGRASGALVTFA